MRTILKITALLFIAFTVAHTQTISLSDQSTMSNLQTDTNNNQKNHIFADSIYHNGQIITVSNKSTNPDFVAVKDGKIIAVGQKGQEYGHLINSNTVLINLQGKTLIPGFYDAHSHFGMTATLLNIDIDISPPPFGNVKNIVDIQNNLKTYITKYNVAEGTSVYATGYNDFQLAQHRHPTRYDLDYVSTVHPICLNHFSGHVQTCNSLALQLLNYTDTSVNPQGGELARFANGSITGVLKQWALVPAFIFSSNFAKLNKTQIDSAVYSYFSSGVTTAHDMLKGEREAIKYNQLGDNFPLDIKTYWWVTNADLTILPKIKSYETKRFKLAGAKFLLDGSIQAYSALLSQPYWVPQQHFSDDLTNYTYNASRSCATQYCGSNDFPYPTLLRNLFMNLYTNNIDVLAHCNGDKASQIFIDTIRYVKNYTNISNGSKFVMIHAQNVKESQLDEMVELDITPSFFSPHIYYWGQKHYSTFLGPARANRMNPANSALKRNLTFTLHNDSPTILTGKVNGINTFLQIIEVAAVRSTSKGRILGQQQRIPVYQALKAVTINSAKQARQDHIKGSLEVGKIADMVILSNNLLTVDPKDITKTVEIVATIKDGVIVYGADNLVGNIHKH